MADISRRTALATLAGAASAGSLVPPTSAALARPGACACIIASQEDTPTISVLIAAHRALILHDETLYGDEGEPLVEAVELERSDAALATAWLALMRAPCASIADVQAKVDYILNGTIGERTPLVDGITGPDGSWTFDPAGPLMLFLASLTPETETGRA